MPVNVTSNMVIFFGDHELSNWYPCDFVHEGLKYHTSEQYYMSQKALCFGDHDANMKIMTTIYPKIMKKWGKSVKGFNEATWDEHKYRVMIDALYLKFSQNPYLRDYLLSTGEKYLAEGSPYDKIWGTGKAITITDATKWSGTNLLGLALMHIRSVLLQEGQVIDNK